MATSVNRNCYGKQMFKSEASAKRRAEYLKITGAREDRGQRPYYCKDCRCWHLTTMRTVWGRTNGQNNKARRDRRSRHRD
jgi:hypothetical protein